MPGLRFPAFADFEPWAPVPLLDVLREHGEKSDGEAEVHSVSLAKGVVPQIEHLGRSFAAATTAHYSLVRPYDVVYTRSPLADFKLGIVKQHRGAKDAIVSPLYGVFTPKNRYLGRIIEAYFENPVRSLKYLDPIAQKGAKNTIQLTNSGFLAGAIPLPADEAEQKAVADWLEGLDHVLALERSRFQALRMHRRGLVQQLFPRPGETRPRLRFPEFRDSGDWGERAAGACFRHRTERGAPGLPLFSVTMHDGLVRRDSFARDYYDIEDAAGNKRAYRGDLVYNMMRMWQGALGVASEDCLVSPAYVVLEPVHGAVADFFAILFKQPAMLDVLNAHSRGLTEDRLRLYYDDFASIKLRVPSGEEQAQIAECFAALDQAVTAQARRIDAVVKHRRGLLQKVFPSPEVVTA